MRKARRRNSKQRAPKFNDIGQQKFSGIGIRRINKSSSVKSLAVLPLSSGTRCRLRNPSLLTWLCSAPFRSFHYAEELQVGSGREGHQGGAG